MMPLKQGKILPPPSNVFLLHSARAPSAPCEPCMTGVIDDKDWALRAQSLKLSHVGIRGQEPRVVFLSMKLVAECCESESRVGPVAQDNSNLSTMAWCIAPVWREEGCHGRQLSAVCW